MAAGYFRSLVEKNGLEDVDTLSAGTFAGDGESASQHSIRSMGKLGIDISNHRSAPLTKELVESADIIVAMTSSHKTAVGSLSPVFLAKTRLLSEISNGDGDIQDPFGGDFDIYDDCLKSMVPHLTALCEEIIQAGKTKKRRT